jgi:asparagine synthetase B (glutamine-hydrolysing)
VRQRVPRGANRLIAVSGAPQHHWSEVIDPIRDSAPREGAEWEGSWGRIAAWGPQVTLASAHGVAVAAHNRAPKCLAATAILGGYLASGFSYLDGMRGRFSFVLCDERQRIFAGGRDVLGRCGLAWCRSGEEFWFSTSVIDLLPVLRKRIHWDRVYLSDWFLGLASQCQVRTAFDEIKRCMPGQLVYREGEETRHRQFDSIHDDAAPGGLTSAVERFQFLAERGMLEFDERAVLLLSGGIDSMALASAWSRTRSSFHALTYRLPDEVVGSEDSRRLHRLECCGKMARSEFRIPRQILHGEWLESWLNESVRLFDDPPIGSPALLPARWLTYQEAKRRGFEIVINGEGGDEIFDLAASPLDMWRERARVRAILMLLLDERYRSLLSWKRFLSQPRGLLARYRGFEHDEAFVIPLGPSMDFINSDAANTALNAFTRRIQLKCFHDRLMAILMSGASESARSAAEGLGEAAGVRVESPLWEPEMAELACSLRAADRLGLSVSKPLLTESLRAWGDAGICSKATIDSCYSQAVESVGANLLALLSERVRVVDLLSSWIDSKALRYAPDGSRAAQGRLDMEFIVRLCFGAAWMAAIQDSFDIS